MTPLEISANLFVSTSIVLAARRSLHTWWTGIVGCALFGLLFYQTQLYAEATLQAFFIGSSAWGWWHWKRSDQRAEPPVRRTRPAVLLVLVMAALSLTAGYGAVLRHFTDAYAPFIDSAVLAVSVVAQLLLMQRRIETWPAWLIVNSLTIPLLASRGLHFTAGVYVLYWFNAWYGWWHWRALQQRHPHGE